VPEDAPPYADYTFRWGCTSNLPDGFVNVVNTAKAIHWCSDKRQGRLDMQAAGVPTPHTHTAEEFADNSEAYNGKWVLRPERHAQGRYLVTGTPAAIRRVLDVDDVYIGGYVSRLIDKVAEYRVMVVQNRVAWVAKKTPGNPEDVAWNVAQGGRFDNVRWGDWPIKVVQAALAAAKVGGLDFGGVDVMVDAQGNPYVLEVNSAPSQTSPYRQQCLAKCFDHIVTSGKQHFPNNVISTWKDAIHPAVWSSSRE
jgi:glutathione synthase/RimK-type ligase-like ATP-grasp enzyme